jgi:hypothetical protein
VGTRTETNGLTGSSILLAVAALLLAGVAVTQIAGDPTGGVVFYTFGFAAALLVGIALVIAARTREDLFGPVGLAGAIIVLATSVTAFFPVIVVGVAVVTVAVARTAPRLLPGLLLLLVGIIGLLVRADVSDDAYTIFVPVLAIGSAVLAATLRRV